MNQQNKFCPSCKKPLKLIQINFDEKIYLCIQKNVIYTIFLLKIFFVQCTYPLEEKNLEEFFVEENKKEEFQVDDFFQ